MMERVTSDAVPAVASSPGPIVLRPSRAAYARAVRANLWVAIPLLAVSLLRIGTNWWLLPFFVVVLLLTFGGVLLYFRNSYVEFGEGSYTAVSMLGIHRTFLASDASSVVTVTSLIGTGAPMTSLLIVLGRNGAKLLKLRSQTWEVEQFVQLATDLNSRGVPIEPIREPITAAQLRDRFPRAVSWVEAHPIALGLILGVAILIVILIVIVVVVVPSVFLVTA